MANCNLCMSWNAPLMIKAHRSSEGTLVAMSYSDWMWYTLHVAMHQANNWAGEIDEYAKELLDPPLQQA